MNVTLENEVVYLSFCLDGLEKTTRTLVTVSGMWVKI